MNFINWLIKEEEGKIFAYKKQNPKDPSKYFVVLYGGTKPFQANLEAKD